MLRISGMLAVLAIAQTALSIWMYVEDSHSLLFFWLVFWQLNLGAGTDAVPVPPLLYPSSRTRDDATVEHHNRVLSMLHTILFDVC